MTSKKHTAKEEKNTLELTHKKREILRRGTPANTLTIENTKKYTCSLCPLETAFTTKIGLSQHLRSKHPETYHAMKTVQSIKKKKRWTEPEMKKYGKIHRKITSDGNKISNAKIAKMLNEEDNGRSVESLKKLLSNPRYKEIFDQLPSHRPTRQTLNPQKEEEKIPDILHNSQIEPDMEHIDNLFKKWMAKRFKDASKKKKKEKQLNQWMKKNKRRTESTEKWRTQFVKNPIKTSRKAINNEPLFTPRDRTFPEKTYDFWKNQFEGLEEDREKEKDEQAPPQWKKYIEFLDDATLPITNRETKKTLKKLKDSAHGPDFITKDMLQNEEIIKELTKWFNCFVEIRNIPKSLKSFRTILIKKDGKKKNDPGNYRPISIGSIIRRLFSKILHNRIESIVELDKRQKGFTKVQGCSINIHTLNASIVQSKHNLQPIHYIFLDIKKAFDSVDHSKLLSVFADHKLPKSLGQLLNNMHKSNQTKLADIEGDQIKIKRGVLQGDPLSPLIFNLVLNKACETIKNFQGIQLGTKNINRLLFADDTVLMASNHYDLQEITDKYTESLKSYGLQINPRKCASVSIETDRKKKQWYVNEKPIIKIDGVLIKALKTNESYKYLGIKMTPMGPISDAPDKLQKMLDNIRSIPLKPQQKLFALRKIIFPRTLYNSIMTIKRPEKLKEMDKDIREFVRKECHLPKDTPTSAFYTKAKHGGLALPNIQLTTERAQAKQYKHIKKQAEEDSIVEEVTKGHYWNIHFKYAKRTGIETLETRPEVYWRKRLYKTVDGAGLKQFEATKCHASEWITNPNRIFMTSSEYRNGIKTRLAVLSTRERESRGRSDMPRTCLSCPEQPGTLAHMLISCPKNSKPITARHNTIYRMIIKELIKKHRHMRAKEEMVIRTKNRTIRPDVIVLDEKKMRIIILEMTIVGDRVPLEKSFWIKWHKYHQPQYMEKIKEKLELSSEYKKLETIPIVISWRGCWCGLSYRLLEELGLSKKFLEKMSIETLLQGKNIHSISTNPQKKS